MKTEKKRYLYHGTTKAGKGRKNDENKKYLLLKADSITSLYRLTVIELVRRGFRFSEAKAAVKHSTLLEDARKYWSIPRDMGSREWADYALTHPVDSDARDIVISA